MNDLDTDAAVDPAFARVQPRWGGARTERNLAATFHRIERVRRTRVAVGVVGVVSAGAVMVVAFLGARSPVGEVARETPALARQAVATAAPPVRAVAEVPEPARVPQRQTPVVEVSRVDFKIASARALFKRQVARRQYAEAYRALVAAPDVADQSAEGLMLAADAARLSGHVAESVPYFRRLLRDHAGDARAPVGAFTLGRILLTELDRPGEAADAFALARRLAPTGPLAADALAREVEAAARAGASARARSRAQEYVSRYPSGPRADAVRRAGGLE